MSNYDQVVISELLNLSWVNCWTLACVTQIRLWHLLTSSEHFGTSSAKILGIGSLHPHLHHYSLKLFIQFLLKTMSHPTPRSARFVCCLFWCCFVILGMSSESEQSVTTDNDDWNVGEESNTKICCVSSVRQRYFISHRASDLTGRTIRFM